MKDRAFQQICALTNLRDQMTLTTLIESGVNINTKQGDFSPIGYFAKNNDKAAVDFLLFHFQADLQHALFCAAWGGHNDLAYYLLSTEHNPDVLEELYMHILRGILRDVLLQGMSYKLSNAKNSKNLFNTYCERVKSFCNGDLHFTFKLLDSISFDKNSVKSTFLYEEVGASVVKAIIPGLLNYDQAIDLYQTYNDEMWQIEYPTTKLLDNSNQDEFSKFVKVLPRLMNEHVYDESVTLFGDNPSTTLTYEQAKVWFQPELHCWLLIGIEKYRDHSLTLDLFLLLTAVIFKIATEDASALLQRHLHSVPRQLKTVELKKAESIYENAGDIRDKLYDLTVSSPLPTLFSRTKEKNDALIKRNKDKVFIENKYKIRTFSTY